MSPGASSARATTFCQPAIRPSGSSRKDGISSSYTRVETRAPCPMSRNIWRGS